MAMRFLAGAALALAFAASASAQPVNTGHLTAELLSQAQGIAPGQTIHVALRQQIQKGWHTYWRNPGDSGEPTRLTWSLPEGWSAGAFTWPAPHRLPIPPLLNYGYTDEVLLPMTLTAPATAAPGETVTLRGEASFLVCEVQCIPEQAQLTLVLPVTEQPALADPRWAPAISRVLLEAPKPAGLAAAFERRGDALRIAIAGAPLAGANAVDAYFYPYAGATLDHSAPQVIDRGPQGLTLTVPVSDELKRGGPAPDVLDGVLSLDGRVYEVSAAQGPAPAGASGLGPPRVETAAPGGFGLAGAALLAFLGGLILNLMPCVFPILAMKAASLAGHAHEAPEARRQGLAFGAGVLATFLLLAGALIALQAGGAAVGWGFQLQSPPVVAALALLMLAVALNLSGVFEVGASLQGAGSGLASRRGLAGAFFTGALAVVVAAPCTAPFMAPAIGWALVQPPAAALTVFLALGLGFAAPFVAVSFAPALLARLPRPGTWMDLFKKALAFPMYAAAAWLVWVLTVQAGDTALVRILAAAIVLAAAAWLGGLAQRRIAAGGKPVVSVVISSLLLAVAIFAAVGPDYAEAGAAESADLASEAWSPERVAALQAEGRPVFVNFTAAWCVSCQVNDRVALSTRGAVDAMARHKVAYLKADWTRKDAVIAAELARHGRAGVPLYLVYGAGGGEPAILSNILTEGAVVRAFDAAAAR
jgi:thiol:disulfide interchange protein/DsbC/DsbD-like thiol-disulfide interchange protein